MNQHAISTDTPKGATLISLSIDVAGLEGPQQAAPSRQAPARRRQQHHRAPATLSTPFVNAKLGGR